jgi:fructose-1,6-bisphosphatase/sedoheptulose 1,7-bisphosphatase-like protein
MAETIEETAAASAQPVRPTLCSCEQYVRVTEGAALTAARWLGRADQEAAERDAAEAMRAVLDDFSIRGRIVVGPADEGSPLRTGETVGAGGEEVDLALDPLEGRGVVARGGNGAMAMIAVGEPGSLLNASISAAIRGTNDHLAIGIGGTRQAVMSAAALRCLGGELQAQLWPTSRQEIEQAHEAGIQDETRVFTTEELAPGEVIVAATGVSNGDLLRGVRFLADSARTHSLVMCTRCNWVRFIDGIHFFARERREEVRLLGY